MIATLFAVVQAVIFVACHMALIRQEEYSGCLVQACEMLQQIAHWEQWYGREWWSYPR